MAVNSLNIIKTPYSYALRNGLSHNCYLDAFNTLRHQQEDFTDSSPFISDFTSHINTLNVSLPYPVSEPMCIENPIDFCQALLLQKKEYNSKISLHLNAFKVDKKRLRKRHIIRATTRPMKMPKYIFELARDRIRDPDIHFSGNYNWYYTGGILDKCVADNTECLIYANNENLLCVKNDIKELHFQPWELDKTPIHNIKFIENNILICRQKHKVCVLQLYSSPDGYIFDVLKTERDRDNIPYIDARYNCNELSILNINRQIKTIDIQTETHTKHNFEELHKKPSDKFGQFDYLNRDNLLFLDRTSIRIYDKRSQDEKHFIVEDSWFKCDKLCNFTMSQNRDYVFLATLHKIIKFDLRQMGIVKAWSHMLSLPPSMMKSEYFGDEELLFASTQKYDERIILLSNSFESNLVQLVPNNIDTLTECNKSYNFKFYLEHKDRLEYNTAGICMAQCQNGIKLYTCNTLGDIFQNNVSTNFNLQSNVPLENIDKWMQSFPRINKPILANNLKECSYIKDIAKEQMGPLGRYFTTNSRKRKLFKDVDIENVDMAAIWLDEDEKREDLVPPTSINDKVSGWLQDIKYDSDEEFMTKNPVQ